MSNVLDLYDQTYFSFERAAGVTNLLQCVWVYNRAHRHRRSAPVPSPSPAGTVVPSHRTLTVAVRPPSLGLAQRSARARDRRDAAAARRIRRLARRAGQHPAGCRARTRMAPRGAAVHRRRRRGELGRLPLPHRRRRALRGVGGRGFRPPRPDQLACCRVTPAVAGAARGRPPNRARHPRYRPRRRRRGTIRPASPRRRRSGHRAASPVRRSRRTCHSVNGNDLRRRRRVGRPRTLARGDQQHAARGTGGPARPASGSGHRRRLRSPRRYPSTSARPAIPAPTPSRMSTSPSTPHPRQPTCARSGPQPSKR